MNLVLSRMHHPQQAGQGALWKSPICVSRRMAAGEDANPYEKERAKFKVIKSPLAQMAGTPEYATA